MAEATFLRNNALPYPVYGAPWTIVLPILDADGDLVTGASAPDSEISKNGDTFADCTNEATEIATNSGMYYLSLTGTELTTDVASIIVKNGTAGAKTTPIVLYPRKLAVQRSGTSASGGASTSTIVLDASASAVDDYYNGMLCVATIDSNIEARVITDYTGSTQTATVAPDWNVAPDNNDTFIVYLTDSATTDAYADKTGYALTTAERNSVADALLNRDMSTGSDSGSTTVRTVRQALRFLRNKWSIAAGTLTVCKEDDSTSSWTAAVSTDAAADPVISTDPAGP